MLPIGFYDESLSGCQGYQHVLQVLYLECQRSLLHCRYCRDCKQWVHG